MSIIAVKTTKQVDYFVFIMCILLQLWIFYSYALFGMNLVSDNFTKFYLPNGGSIGSGQEREVVLPDKVNLALQSEQDPNWHSSPLKPWVQFSAYIWNLFSWVPTAPTVFRRQKQGQLHVHFGCLVYVRIWDMRMIFFSVLRVEPKAPCVGCVLYN